MKILGPQDTGKGILVEMDAGYISPNETHNKNSVNKQWQLVFENL